METKYNKKTLLRLKLKITKNLFKMGNKLSKFILGLKKDSKDLNDKDEKELDKIISIYTTLIVEDIIIFNEKEFESGNSFLNNELSLNIAFDKITDKTEKYNEYLKGILTTQLSETSKKNVESILKEGLKNGDSYGTISKQLLSKKVNGFLSKQRAELIAINELGNAYEFGKRETTLEFEKETGETILKK